MTQLTEAQRTAENSAEFIKSFKNLHMAGVPITMVRTREPARAMLSLKNFTFAEQGLAFATWDVSVGWQTYDKDRPTEVPAGDGVMALPLALAMIDPPDEDGFGPGVYVLVYPHMKNELKNPVVVSTIKRYAQQFTRSKKRLVLLCPLTASLDTELEDDVTIMDFDTPSYAEFSGPTTTSWPPRTARSGPRSPRRTRTGSSP